MTTKNGNGDSAKIEEIERKYWCDKDGCIRVKRDALLGVPETQITEDEVRFPSGEFGWLDGTVTDGRSVVPYEADGDDIVFCSVYLSHQLIEEEQTVIRDEGTEWEDTITYVEGETIDTGDLGTVLYELKGHGFEEVVE